MPPKQTSSDGVGDLLVDGPNYSKNNGGSTDKKTEKRETEAKSKLLLEVSFGHMQGSQFVLSSFLLRFQLLLLLISEWQQKCLLKANILLLVLNLKLSLVGPRPA